MTACAKLVQLLGAAASLGAAVASGCCVTGRPSPASFGPVRQ
jgi:hypothetical protein